MLVNDKNIEFSYVTIITIDRVTRKSYKNGRDFLIIYTYVIPIIFITSIYDHPIYRKNVVPYRY